MATQVTYTGDGSTTDFNLTFPYLATTDVYVKVAGVDTSYSYISGSAIRISPAPAAGAQVHIYRGTSLTDRAVDFTDGSVLTEEDLDKDSLQAFYKAQELSDELGSATADLAALEVRSLRVSSGTIPEVPAVRAGKFLAFDTDGNPVASAGTGADLGLRSDLSAPTGAGLVKTSSGGTVEVALAQLAGGAVEGETGVVNPFYPVGDVRRYGVFPDAVDVTGVTFTSGSATLTAAAGTFTTNMVGMSVCSPFLTGSVTLTPPKIATVAVDGSSCTLVNWSTLLAQNAVATGTGGCRIGTYWERDFPSRIAAILNNSVLPGVEIYMPPGAYNTNINMGTAQSGSKWHLNSVEMGLLHTIADPGFPGSAGPLQKVRMRGRLTTYDRFGAIGLQNSDLSQLNVVCRSDPTKCLTGTVGRGVHIYTQIIDNHFGDFTVEDCGVGTALNTDGAFTMDSSECARNRFGKLWVKDSAGHGVVIMGCDHEFESIVVDGWGYGTADRQIPETPNLARCLELTGVWFHRAGGCRVDNLRVNQPASGRSNAIYDIRFTDGQNSAGVPAVYAPVHIRTANASNIRHRGITVGDRVTAVGCDEVEFGTLTVQPVSGSTIDAGYSLVHVNANSSPANYGYTKLVVRQLVCRNPSTSINDLLQCSANTEIDIGVLDTSRVAGHAGRVLVLNGRGRVGRISHRQSGGSGSPTSVTIANDGPVNIGICDLNAPALPSIAAFDLSGAANFDIGPITALGYRGTPVVKIVGASNGVVRIGQLSEPSAAGTGLTFTGNTNVRLESGKVTGLAKGTTGAAGGNTRCSAVNVEVTGNTINTDLAAGQVLTDGSCLNVTL